MDQSWEVVAYERRETLGQSASASGLIPSTLPACLIHLLTVPVAVEPDGDAGCGTTTAHQSPQHHSHLLQLPLDIILLITDELDLNSLYTLTHCCWLLRSLLRTEVDTRFRRTLAPWANTPLLCAGQFMKSNPPGVTTRVPKDFTPDPTLKENITPEEYINLTVYDLMRHMQPINVLDSSTCLSPPSLHPELPERGDKYRPPKLPWKNILKIKKYFPPGRHWVLRNLTTKEYVYAHAFTSLSGGRGEVDSPDAIDIWGYTLGTLVVVNTCWSDDSNVDVSGLSVRGRWAGHCFDIVEEARLLHDMKAGDGVWVNVTLREYMDMVDLFKENGFFRFS